MTGSGRGLVVVDRRQLIGAGRRRRRETLGAERRRRRRRVGVDGRVRRRVQRRHAVARRPSVFLCRAWNAHKNSVKTQSNLAKTKFNTGHDSSTR